MKKIARFIFLYLPAGFLALSILWVLLYKVVPVRWTPLMLKRAIENRASDSYKNQHK